MRVSLNTRYYLGNDPLATTIHERPQIQSQRCCRMVCMRHPSTALSSVLSGECLLPSHFQQARHAQPGQLNRLSTLNKGSRDCHDIAK
jgi:hypothetical protein